MNQREFIIDKGSEGGELDYGARPLRRSVERYIEDPLAEELLRGAFEGKNKVLVRVNEVGDEKRLDFDTSYEAETEELATVGSAEGESGSSPAESQS